MGLTFNRSMVATTPSKTNGQIGALCKLINSKAQPVYLKAGVGKPGYCILNAIQYYLLNPGTELVSGWILWQGTGITEAEHHTLIKHNDQLIDVTTPVDGESKILFLQDPSHYCSFSDGHIVTYGNFIKKKMEKFYHLEGRAKSPVGGTFKVIGKPCLTEQAREHFLAMPYDNYSLVLRKKNEIFQM